MNPLRPKLNDALSPDPTSSYFDPFTQLKNRTALRLHTQETLAQIGDGVERGCALILLSLRRHQTIVTRYGLATGDAYLFAWAQRLRHVVGNHGECFFVAGDDFAVVIDEANGIEMSDLRRRLDHWHQLLTQPFNLAEKQLDVTVAIGVSCALVDGQDFDEMHANAYSAQLEACGLDEHDIIFYTTVDGELRESQQNLISDLNHAIEDQQFVLHYQPIVNAQTRQVVALEALIRWNHPQRGLVSPMEFIPTAEHTGLIHEIGSWLVQQVDRDQQHWKTQRATGSTCIAFNVSPLELAEQDYLTQIDRMLNEQNPAEVALEIEITEHLMVQYPERSERTLRRLQKRGLRIVIDDFGAGYASLQYLQRFPVDKIKIDRHYIKGLQKNSRERAVVAATLQLARDLGVDVVAEGVENQEQLQALESMGCALMQGYHLCAPQPLGELTSWIDAYEKSAA